MSDTPSTFSFDVARWAAKTKLSLDEVLRRVSEEMAKRIIARTPVGNPELWAANEEAVAHNTALEEANSALRENPANRNRRGYLRPGLKRNDRRRLPVGRGYVGGRAKNNWFVTIGAPTTETTDQVDPTGRGTLARAAAALKAPIDGRTIYILNNLPYAVRLEYGHSSKQAPAGMVRVTLAEIQAIMEESIRNLDKPT